MTIQDSAPREISGLVFSVMRFSLHDGPGIRTTVFLKGCPLRCEWCHNPESQVSLPEIMFAAERCIRCGDCVEACPEHAIEWNDGPIRHAEACRRCGRCAEACLSGARQFIGKQMLVPELVKVICRDLVFFDESGGGVTFSGGEPLMQPDFLETALEACGRKGIHRVVDTCGYAAKDVLLRISRNVDLFLYDLKLMDPAKHRQFTGVSNELILENLATLAEGSVPLRVRIPLVPGVNDDDQNVAESLRFLAGLGLRQVELLPYHNIGKEKYARLQLQYRMEEVAPPGTERMEEIADLFRSEGFAVHSGG